MRQGTGLHLDIAIDLIVAGRGPSLKQVAPCTVAQFILFMPTYPSKLEKAGHVFALVAKGSLEGDLRIYTLDIRFGEKILFFLSFCFVLRANHDEYCIVY